MNLHADPEEEGVEEEEERKKTKKRKRRKGKGKKGNIGHDVINFLKFNYNSYSRADM